MKKFAKYLCIYCYAVTIAVNLFQKGLYKNTVIQEKSTIVLTEAADKFMQSVLSMWKFLSVASVPS